MRKVVLFFLISIITGCQRTPRSQPANPIVILGSAVNMNNKCVGHAEHLCGPEDERLPNEIAGIFATEPKCEGVTLRGLTKEEETAPSNQIPLLLDVYYVGSHANIPYNGTGQNETEGWMFTFNGPHGHFSANARTEQELVNMVCNAAKGLGSDIDKSVGYSK